MNIGERGKKEIRLFAKVTKRLAKYKEEFNLICMLLEGSNRVFFKGGGCWI